jgi:hypothetical protein
LKNENAILSFFIFILYFLILSIFRFSSRMDGWWKSLCSYFPTSRFYFSFSCQCFVKKFYDKDTIRLNLSLWHDIFILFAAWGWHLCHYYVEWAASDKCMKIIIDLSVNFYDFFFNNACLLIFFACAGERELWSDFSWVVTLFWWKFEIVCFWCLWNSVLNLYFACGIYA